MLSPHRMSVQARRGQAGFLKQLPMVCMCLAAVLGCSTTRSSTLADVRMAVFAAKPELGQKDLLTTDLERVFCDTYYQLLGEVIERMREDNRKLHCNPYQETLEALGYDFPEETYFWYDNAYGVMRLLHTEEMIRQIRDDFGFTEIADPNPNR